MIDLLNQFDTAFYKVCQSFTFQHVVLNWNNQDLDVKTRSIITVVALMASGITDSSLRYHLQNAKNHGVTQKEIAAVITHVAFYAGWPKAWAVFNLAKEVWELSLIHIYQLLLLMLAETGYRIGELLGVKYVKDIDYRNHMIRVCSVSYTHLDVYKRQTLHQEQQTVSITTVTMGSPQM